MCRHYGNDHHAGWYIIWTGEQLIPSFQPVQVCKLDITGWHVPMLQVLLFETLACKP